MKDGTIWTLFVASVAILGIGATAAYRQTQGLIADLTWVTHGHAVIAAIDNLKTTVGQTASLADSYVFTGDDSYAFAFQRASASLRSKFGALRDLTSSDPSEATTMKTIDLLLQEHMAKLEQITPRTGTGATSKGAQLTVVQDLRGLDTQLLQELDSAATAETHILSSREERSIQSSKTSKIFIASTGLLGMLLLSLAFLGFQHHLKQRRKAEVRLQKLNEELEWRVTQRVAQFHEVNRNLIMEAVRREEAEQDVQQQREFLRLVIDTDPNLIFVKNWDGRFVLANRATAEIYATTADELIGKSDADFNKDQQEVEHFRQDDQAVIASREPKFIAQETVTDARTGEKRWFQTYKVPLKRASNSVSQLLGVSTDITQHKLAEEQLRHTQEQLVQSQKMDAIGRLAGGLAHDFNNILNVILGYGEQALETLGPDTTERRYVQRIVDAGNRAARLMQQLLAFSRKQVLQPRIMSLNAAVVEMEQLLERLAGEDIEISVKLDPDLGAIKADPTQMERVIMNLAVNAREAMPNGGKLMIETVNAELDVSYTSQHTPVVPGRYVMLAISDTGLGIDAEIQSKIFDPFFTTKGPGKGTGLGLSTVYGIVNQTGGYVWVYSEPDKGATFKLYFPRVDGVPETVVPVSSSVALPSGSETILVVEDDGVLCDFICEVLRANGYSVYSANNGAQALQLVREHGGSIHLLLTDVVMPGLSGRALAGQMISTHPTLKVLYMSGYTENAIVHHGVLDPGVDLIQKPFTVGALSKKVRELLEKKSL